MTSKNTNKKIKANVITKEFMTEVICTLITQNTILTDCFVVPPRNDEQKLLSVRVIFLIEKKEKLYREQFSKHLLLDTELYFTQNDI